MEKPYYKAIILVLASDNDPLYSFFKRVYESYMFENPSIKILFTYGQGTKFEKKDYDLVYDDLKETPMPPDITKKVTRSFEYIDKNFSYDYVIRTNLSTFWDLNKLLNRLSKLPKTKCFAGKKGIFQPLYITGTSMVISSDLIKLIIQNQHIINDKIYPKYVAEDKLLSDLITKNLNVVPIISNQNICIFDRYTFFDEDSALKVINFYKTTEVDHYRVKNFRGDRMEIDTKIMQLLLKNYYNKEILI